MVNIPKAVRKIRNLIAVANKSRLELMGEGGDRIVFALDSKRVIKIPLHEWGVRTNENELRLFQEDETGRYAKILDVKRPFGIPCLIQERVQVMWTPYCDYDADEVPNMPHWAYDLVDGEQVGVAACGNIKVYDYACE